MANASGYKKAQNAVVELGVGDPGQLRTMIDFAVRSYMASLSNIMSEGEELDMGLITGVVCDRFAKMYKGTGKIQAALAYVCKGVRMDITQGVGNFVRVESQANTRYGSIKGFLDNLDTYIDQINGDHDEEKE